MNQQRSGGRRYSFDWDERGHNRTSIQRSGPLNRIEIVSVSKWAFVVLRARVQQVIYTPKINKYEFLKFPTTFPFLLCVPPPL